jgi:hypothetical protein
MGKAQIGQNHAPQSQRLSLDDYILMIVLALIPHGLIKTQTACHVHMTFFEH